MKRGTDRLLFGTAGIPIRAKGSPTPEGIKTVKDLGLDCMEIEFVRQVYLKPKHVPDIISASKENDIVLTCHAPYYINLNGDAKIVKASIKRIVDSAVVLDECNGYSVCFHPAYYGNTSKEAVYETVKKNFKDVLKQLKDRGVIVWIRPETMGRHSQFGTLKECVGLSEDLENVLPCIDFSHLHARAGGKFNTYDEFADALTLIEKMLGKNALKNMHIHAQGIEYSDKGELNHLNLKDSDFNYKELLKTWKEFKIKGCVICESPNIEEDALLLKKTFNQL